MEKKMENGIRTVTGLALPKHQEMLTQASVKYLYHLPVRGTWVTEAANIAISASTPAVSMRSNALFDLALYCSKISPVDATCS